MKGRMLFEKKLGLKEKTNEREGQNEEEGAIKKKKSKEIRSRKEKSNKEKSSKKKIQESRGNLKSFFLGMVVTMILFVPSGYVLSKEFKKKTIDVYYDDIKVIVNAEEIPLRNEAGEKVEPFLYQGTTYVPLRAISESFGKSVWWDDSAKRVIIFEELRLEENRNSDVDVHNLPVPISKKAFLKEGMTREEIHEILGLPQCKKETEKYQEDIYYFEDGEFLVVRIEDEVAIEFFWKQEVERKAEVGERLIIQETITEEEKGFEDNEVIKQQADKIIIGKVKEIQNVSNYCEKTNEYGETYTYAKIEILKDCLEIQANEKEWESGDESIEVMFYGGTIPYEEYERSLEASERVELDRLRGFLENPEKKKNTFVASKIKEQEEIEEGKVYLLYLKYSDIYEKYVPISEIYGVREYNIEEELAKNPKTKIWETVKELGISVNVKI